MAFKIIGTDWIVAKDWLAPACSPARVIAPGLAFRSMKQNDQGKHQQTDQDEDQTQTVHGTSTSTIAMSQSVNEEPGRHFIPLNFPPGPPHGQDQPKPCVKRRARAW